MARARSPRSTKKAVLGVFLLAAWLSACGSGGPHALDSAKIERAVAGSILRQHMVHARVLCPMKMTRRAGGEFTCMAHLDAGVYPVTVTEIGNSAGVRYRNPRPLRILDITKVERAIESSVRGERHLRARATCPGEVLQQQGVSFRCSAVIDGRARHYPFLVREIDDAGHVRYLGI